MGKAKTFKKERVPREPKIPMTIEEEIKFRQLLNLNPLPQNIGE